MGGTPEVRNCLYAIKTVVATIKQHHKDKSKMDFPEQGFVGLGSFDQNWGWLR